MSRDPLHLHPILRPILERHRDDIYRRTGLRTVCFETYRDNSAQTGRFMQGRNERGEVVDASKVVTNARPGHSWHNLHFNSGVPCSLAYHLGILLPDGSIIGLGSSKLDEAGEDLYSALCFIGEGLGLTAGGRWRMRDWTHFEYHPNGATLGQVVAALNAAGDIHPLMEA